MKNMRSLEVCAGSVESVRAAYEGGAERIELCASLSEDGLTPSLGMIRFAKSFSGMKVHVLIRPRSGDFIYSESEIRCMEEDIRACRELGVDGVVIGALKADKTIDQEACQRLKAAAGEMSVTFHRAFDLCKKPFETLEQIIALGCDRLLTSGQAEYADRGVPLLRQLVEQAAGRIVIMPGCGVNPNNAADILDRTGAVEIHASARSPRVFGRLETDSQVVKKIIENINQTSGLA